MSSKISFLFIFKSNIRNSNSLELCIYYFFILDRTNSKQEVFFFFTSKIKHNHSVLRNLISHFIYLWNSSTLSFEIINLHSIAYVQLHPTLWPHSLPGSSAHGIPQARILEWVAIPFSRGSSWPRDRTQVSWIAGRFFTIWATRETHILL